MKHVVALTVDRVPHLPGDRIARRFVLEFDDGSWLQLGIVATDIHRLAGELAGLEPERLPYRLEIAPPKRLPCDPRRVDTASTVEPEPEVPERGRPRRR